MKKVDVIAIDGPSGAGKSTIAKRLSEKIGYEYISTGAMYRLVGMLADKKGIFYNDEKVKKLCDDIKNKIDFKEGKIFYNGKDITSEIYKNKVSMLASEISKRAVVREVLTGLQRAFGLRQKSILEGRDIGTVVFPDAKFKFFLDASAEVRAKRRFEELKLKGENVVFKKILEEIIKRDKNDSNRELAPLRKADDAVYIDTSNLDIEEVLEKILTIVKNGVK